MSGSPDFSDVANVINSGGGSLVFCSDFVANATAVYYSSFLEDCSYCIGCIGLKNKSYCILNKQYSREEWYVLADRIFARMESDGMLGDFFPAITNPFYFNDTLASFLDPTFTQAEVERDGYLWRDEPIRVDIPDGSDVIGISDLDAFQGIDAQGVWQINPDISKKVIRDAQGNHYKITPTELQFLRRHGLPLPVVHWIDRIKLGFQIGTK